MKLLEQVEQALAWDHWFKIEKEDRYHSLSGDALQAEIDKWRSDIKSPLPNDLQWYKAEIEEGDLNHIYMISSGDWSEISNKTFLALNVSENLNAQTQNDNTIRISKDIKQKISFLENGGCFDTKFVAVSHNNQGPFTLIEGNRRAVALIWLNNLIGTRIFLGISKQVKSYKWARYASGRI